MHSVKAVARMTERSPGSTRGTRYHALRSARWGWQLECQREHNIGLDWFLRDGTRRLQPGGVYSEPNVTRDD